MRPLILPMILLGILSMVYTSEEEEDLQWWQKTIVYQIYPRSFQDSDGDGIGDIQGIISRLDHFVYLGVGAIWLSPVYCSPMADFGYDISNHTDIDPIFGTMADMEDLISSAHSRGIRVIMDYVPNHTSVDHMWFVKSRTGGANNVYSDYYVWSDGKMTEDGTRAPPNNWLSVFGGSAWTWDERRAAFYYHHFLKDQPDLNFRNPAVRGEMEDVLKFWIEKGVDGFRVDAARTLFEVEDLSLDEPPSYLPGYTKNQSHSLRHLYTEHQSEIHVITRHWRRLLDDYKRRTGKHVFVMAAISRESWDMAESMKYYHSGADVPLNTNLFDMRPSSGARWFQHQVSRWMEAMPARNWPSFSLANHGQRRVSTRKGSLYANALNVLLLTLPGTPTCYQGDEIGQLDVNITFQEARDPWGRQYGQSGYRRFTRDPGRAPIQWDDSPNAGFSSADRTWLPVHPHYGTRNIKGQKADLSGQSTLQLFRAAALLRTQPAFLNNRITYGVLNDHVFSYVRQAAGHPTYLVTMNLGWQSSTDDYRRLDDHGRLCTSEGKVVIRAGRRGPVQGQRISLTNVTLNPGEVLVVKVDCRHGNSQRCPVDEL